MWVPWPRKSTKKPPMVRDYPRKHVVLAIEDRESNLRLLEAMCELRPSIALLGAADGASGLLRARESQPDLILLDLHLPDIRGESVLATLRADPATRDIPVVVVTADPTIKLEMDVLTKPYSTNDFLEVVDKYLT